MQGSQPGQGTSIPKIPLDALNELVSDALIGLDRLGRVWGWNRGAERLLGWEAAAVVGQELPCVSPALRKVFDEFLEETWREGSAESACLICTTAGGERLTMTGRGTRLAAAEEKILLLLRRSRVEAAMSLVAPFTEIDLEHFLWQQSRDSIWDWDIPSGRFRVNDRYLEIRGITREEYREDLQSIMASIHEDDLAEVQIAAQRALAEGKRAVDLEYRIRRPNGEIRWTHSIASIAARDANGKAMRMVGIQRDTTERRNTLERLRQNEELLRSILGSLEDVVWAIDNEERIVAVHQSPRHGIFASSETDLTGLTLAEVGLSGEVLHEFREAIWRLKHAPGRESFEYELQLVNGREWYQATLTRRTDSRGECIGATVMLHNITKTKLAEKEAQSQAEAQRGLLDSVQAQVWHLDIESRVTDLNEFTLEQTGLTREEAVGQRLIDLIAVGETRRKFHQWCLDRVIRTGKGHLGHVDTMCLKGETRWYSMDTIPTHDHEGTVTGVLTFMYDITPLKKIESSLRESETRFRLLADAAPVMIWLGDPQGQCTYLNRSLTELMGTSPEELHDLKWLERIHPDDRERAGETIARALRERVPTQSEHRLRDAASRYRWVHNETVPRFSEEGEFLGTIGCCLDVTDRKKTEQRLQRSESLYRSLIENSHDAVMTFFPNGRVDFVNSICESTFGYTYEELRRMRDPIGMLLTPHSELERWRFRNNHIQTGRYPEVTIPLEIRHKDGRIISTECRFANLEGVDNKVSRLLVNIRDLTERLKLDERLRQTEKIEAVGRLAGGMAHDFNNLLTVINGQALLLSENRHEESEEKKGLLEISRAGERAAELTRQLLAFSRKQPQQLQPLSLNDVLAQARQMISSVMGERIELKLELDEELHKIHGDRGQMERVLMNLLVNARDALPEGGKVEVQTRNVQYLWSDSEEYRELRPGAYVELTVRDNGCGMTEEVRAHLFEPFFTTKPMGKGTGLGLPTVYGIVQQNRGTIQVDSEPGSGTTFRILLPAMIPPNQPSVPRPRQANVFCGEETVLLVEDNEAVRALTRQLLTTHGYMVLLARDGQEGLEVSRHFSGTIDLVVSDIVMPRMNGCDLVSQLRVERPGIGVMLMSGYADEELTELRKQFKGSEFLSKPFLPSEFLKRIREILGARVGCA